MRLLLISPGFFCGDIGGVANVVRHLAIGLSERGWDVGVCTTFNKSYPLVGEWEGIRYWQFSFRYRSVATSVRGMLRVVREFHPEVINVHYPIGGQGIAATLLQLVTRVPLVVSLHYSEINHHHPFDRTVARQAIGVSCSVTACSRYLAEQASAVVQKVITPIYNGVTVPKSAVVKNEQPGCIAAAGSLVRNKNFSTLIRAFSNVAQRYPELTLQIAGTGSQEDELRLLAQRLSLESRVAFLGQMKLSEINRLFAAALIVVVPSYLETFGLVALEAMAFGTPVVVSETGGLREIVRHGVDGLVVDPRDPGAMSSAICALLSQPELRLRLGAYARQRASEFTWDKTTESYATLYSRIPAR